MPIEIKTNKKATIQFIKAFWDDEGCITTGRLRIHGALMWENMIDDLIYVHRKLGIECTKWKNSYNGSFVINITNNSDNIRKFSKVINFEYSLITKGKSKGKLKKELLQRKIEKYSNALKNNGPGGI